MGPGDPGGSGSGLRTQPDLLSPRRGKESSIRRLFAGFVAVHGLLHLPGFVEAFGLAETPLFARSVPEWWGAVWLAAGVTLLVTAFLVLHAPRTWWATGAAALILSQAAVVSAWPDVALGTVVNGVLLLGVAYGFASEGPFGLRAEYRRHVAEGLRRAAGTPEPVSQKDLEELPGPLRRYLRVTGAVGRPRVRYFRARWQGRIRGGPEEPWMEFTAEQHNFTDEPSRFFLMDARRSGLPVDVLHVFRGGSASMRVRLLSLVPLVNARGPEMTRAETVTLFNDLCILAPAALVEAPIRWETVDEGSVRGHYTVGDDTVSAVLSFGETGELENFVSDDRLAASPDGSEFTRRRWSTPVEDYRTFGSRRVAARGEGRWHPADGDDFAYFEARLLDLAVGPRAPAEAGRSSASGGPNEG